MHTTERKQAERLQSMTEKEKEQFFRVFFHQAKDTSSQNLHAANGTQDTMEWNPQNLYKLL